MFNIEGSRFSKAFKIHSFRFIRSNYVDYTTFLYGRNIDSSKLHFFLLLAFTKKHYSEDSCHSSLVSIPDIIHVLVFIAYCLSSGLDLMSVAHKLVRQRTNYLI